MEQLYSQPSATEFYPLVFPKKVQPSLCQVPLTACWRPAQAWKKQRWVCVDALQITASAGRRDEALGLPDNLPGKMLYLKVHCLSPDSSERTRSHWSLGSS